MTAPALEPWERRLLRLVSEQGAMPFDQLARSTASRLGFG